MYQTSTEKWWCACSAYKNAGYHICKHLIILYIKEDGLKSNKPRMPFYGQVWRQSTVPVLWVADEHDESELVVHDLRLSNTSKPILRASPASVDLVAPFPIDPVPEIEPVVYDDDDIDEDDEDDNEDQRPAGNPDESVGPEEPKDDERGEFGALVDDDDDAGGFGQDNWESAADYSQLELEGEEKMFKLRLYFGQICRLARALESQVDHPEISLAPDLSSTSASAMIEWANRWHDQEREREERGRQLHSYYTRLQHLSQALEDAMQYEPTHRHIGEIPDPTIANTPAMMNWGDRWFTLQNGRVRKPTWSQERRDNMFLN